MNTKRFAVDTSVACFVASPTVFTKELPGM